jgi:hypothetical protein
MMNLYVYVLKTVCCFLDYIYLYVSSVVLKGLRLGMLTGQLSSKCIKRFFNTPETTPDSIGNTLRNLSEVCQFPLTHPTNLSEGCGYSLTPYNKFARWCQ